MGWNESITQLSTTTSNHADNFNAINKKLLDNTIYNKLEHEKYKEINNREIVNLKEKNTQQDTAIGLRAEKTYTDNELAKKVDDITYKAKVTELEAKNTSQDLANEVEKTRVNSEVERLDKKVDSKITLGEDPQTNFNFIENEVVQDGLIEALSISNFNSEDDFSVFFDLKYSKPGDATKVFGIGLPATGGYQIVLGSTALVFQYRKVGATAWTTESLVPIHIGNTYTIMMYKKKNSIFFKINEASYEYKDLNIQNVSGLLSFVKNSRASTSKEFLYGRQLSPQEVHCNLQVLNNSKSINSINITDKDGVSENFILGTDSYHTTMANGYNVEQAYTGLLKSMGKEFVSTNGSPIDIDNGIEDSKVISGEIQGRTVKNPLVEKYASGGAWLSSVFKGTPISGGGTRIERISLEGEVSTSAFTTSPSDEAYLCNFLKPNTKYTISVNLKSNLPTFKLLLNIGKRDGLYVPIAPLEKICVNGINHITFTTNGTVNSDTTKSTIYLYNSNGTAPLKINSSMTNVGDYIEAYEWSMIEGDSVSKIVPPGLSSTRAIINNNGQSYQIYHPTELNEDGSKKLISLGKAGDIGDILEIKEDNSYIFKMNNFTQKINPTSLNISIDTTGTQVQGFTKFTMTGNILSSVGLPSDKLICQCDKTNALPWQKLYSGIFSSRSIAKSNDLSIRYAVETSVASTVDEFKSFLNNDIQTIIYNIADPTTIYIPKESTPTIPINKINIFSVGDGVNPSSFKVVAPVDRIQELLTRMAAQEAKTNTKPVNVVFVEETYANSVNKIEAVNK